MHKDTFQKFIFQSTLSQGERPNHCKPSNRPEKISIHALARRATLATLESSIGRNISIHALARRATVNKCHFFSKKAISIHALARRATGYQYYRSPTLEISIHALARRATTLLRLLHLLSSYFNPRSRKESD